MPSRESPSASVCDVSVVNLSRDARSSGEGAFRTGHSSKNRENSHRRLVQVRAELVRRVAARRGLQRFAEPEQLQRQSTFRRRFQKHLRAFGRPARLPEDRPRPRVRVLEVHRGVALLGEHPVPGEDVVALAVTGQVGVLDRADAHRPGDLCLLGLVELRAFGDDGRGLRHGFVEQVGQLDRVAGAGPHGLAVRAEHRAEADVLGRAAVSQPASRQAAKSIAKCCACGVPTT